MPSEAAVFAYSVEFHRHQNQPPYGTYSIKLLFKTHVDWGSDEGGPKVEHVYHAAWDRLWDEVAKYPELKDVHGYTSWLMGPIKLERGR